MSVVYSGKMWPVSGKQKSGADSYPSIKLFLRSQSPLYSYYGKGCLSGCKLAVHSHMSIIIYVCWLSLSFLWMSPHPAAGIAQSIQISYVLLCIIMTKECFA